MSQPASHYFVPQPSHWPIFGSAALLLMANGAVLWMNHIAAGPYLLSAGFFILLTMLFGWFANVIRESEGGAYGKNVDMSFRWGMSWFIFSEVMFFAAFFGALFYIRVLSVPDLAHGLNAEYLYQSFSNAWPSAGPGFKGEFEHMSAWGLPAINTALLLTSGVTLTWAHHALIKNNRLQLNLKLTTGGYGSTFFLLTGFHGFHVCLGATMLFIILVRCLKGHFTPDHHFGFEGVAWYWHFVDVVWLLLFVLVYWL